MRSVGKKVFRTGFLAGTVMLLMTLMGGVVHAADSWSTLREELQNGGVINLTNNIIRTEGDSDLVVGANVTLNLNGYYIYNSQGNGSVITIPDGNGCTLTINDGGENDHYITMNNWSVAGISDTGTENFKDGSGTFKVSGGFITGGNTKLGGGVHVGKNNTLIMNGGTIAGNIADADKIEDKNGGGVYVAAGGSFKMGGSATIMYNYSKDNGGGVFTDAGNLEMTGSASITGNTATCGGGVFFDAVTSDVDHQISAEFTMSDDARIADNSAINDKDDESDNYNDGLGGGVYVYGGTFTMSGGVITGNKASGYDSGCGGGVFCLYGKTIINGGSITSNTATSGGGLYNILGDVYLNGGKITQNKADIGGGAVTLRYALAGENERGSFTVSGSGEITGNTKSDGTTAGNLYLLKHEDDLTINNAVYYANEARMSVLTVAGELTGKIALTLDPAVPGTAVARGSEEREYVITEKDVACLIGDDEKFGIGLDKTANTALLGKPFTVKMAEEVTYTGNPFLPEVTSYDGTALVKDKDYTLTINGDNVNYTGNPVTITVTGMGDYAGTHTVTFTIKAPEPKPDTDPGTDPGNDPGNEPQTEPQPEPIMVSSVKLSKTKVTIGKNQTFSLYATVNPADADNKKVTWKSSNSKVVTVNSSGKIKGVKAGSATITATAADGSGKKATCKVTVRKEKIVLVNSIKLDKKSNTISPKESFTLKATVKPTNAKDKNVTWISSDTKVAKVSSKGKVTGVGAGKATITAIAGDKKATCTVTVIKVVKVKGIILNKSKASLKKGETLTLKATILPKDATNKTITWTSSNTKVATVDPKSGKITAKSSGNATITAKAKDGSKIKATCKVTVN